MGYGLKSAKEAETELVGLSRREMAEEGARKRWAAKDRRAWTEGMEGSRWVSRDPGGPRGKQTGGCGLECALGHTVCPLGVRQASPSCSPKGHCRQGKDDP